MIVNNTRPKFAFKRDKSLLSKHNLGQFMENNTYIDELFQWEEPNLIAEILTNELNIIVNSIAPKPKIQLSKKFVPYMNSQIRDRIREQKRLLDIFKRTKSKSDQLNFKKIIGARQMVWLRKQNTPFIMKNWGFRVIKGLKILMKRGIILKVRLVK